MNLRLGCHTCTHLTLTRFFFSPFLTLTIPHFFKFQEPFQHQQQQQQQQPKPIDSIQAITSSPSSDDLHTGNSSAERRSHVTGSSSAERRNHVAGNQQLDTEATIHLVRKGRTIFELQKYFGKLQSNLLVYHAGPAQNLVSSSSPLPNL